MPEMQEYEPFFELFNSVYVCRKFCMTAAKNVVFLISELAKKKQFQQSAMFKDDQERRSGAQTLESFKQSIIDLQQLKEVRDSGFKLSGIDFISSSVLWIFVIITWLLRKSWSISF